MDRFKNLGPSTDSFKKELKARFGAGHLDELHMQAELRGELQRLGREKVNRLVALAAVGVVGSFAFGPITAVPAGLLACGIVGYSWVAQNRAKSLCKLTDCESLPEWLTAMGQDNSEIRSRLIDLVKHQGGVYPWQFPLLKIWPAFRREWGIPAAS